MPWKTWKNKDGSAQRKWQSIKTVELPSWWVDTAQSAGHSLTLTPKTERKTFTALADSKEIADAELERKIREYLDQESVKRFSLGRHLSNLQKAATASSTLSGAIEQLNDVLPILAECLEAHPALISLVKEKVPALARINAQVSQIVNVEAETRPISEAVKLSTAPTLNEAFVALLRSRKVRSDDQRESYQSYWANHFQTAIDDDEFPVALGEIPLDRITVSLLQEWADRLQTPREREYVKWSAKSPMHLPEIKRGSKKTAIQSAQSVSKYKMLLSMIFEYCNTDDKRDWQTGGRNPAKAIIVEIKRDLTNIDYPDMDDYRAMQAAASDMNDIRLSAFMALIANFVRPSEIRALKNGDYEPETGKLHIRASMNEKNVETVGGKNGHSDTIVVMERDRDFVKAAFDLKGKFLIPAYDADKCCDEWEFNYTFDKCKELAGRGERRFTKYLGKHASITDLIDRGYTVDQIVLMTRHVTKDIIQRHYAIRRKDALANAVK